MSTFAYIDLSYMEQMAAGDDDMKTTMIEMIIDELPSDLQTMNELFESENWEELGNLSHKMKSTIAYIGNPSMENANAAIEEITRYGGDTSQLASLFDTLNSECPQVVDELRSLV